MSNKSKRRRRILVGCLVIPCVLVCISCLILVSIYRLSYMNVVSSNDDMNVILDENEMANANAMVAAAYNHTKQNVGPLRHVQVLGMDVTFNCSEDCILEQTVVITHVQPRIRFPLLETIAVHYRFDVENGRVQAVPVVGYGPIDIPNYFELPVGLEDAYDVAIDTTFAQEHPPSILTIWWLPAWNWKVHAYSPGDIEFYINHTTGGITQEEPTEWRELQD